MPAFFRAPLLEFLSVSDSELLGRLTLAHAEEGFRQQLRDATTTWFADIVRLRKELQLLYLAAPQTAHWTVLLEFTIPRKEKRIDVVLLASDAIILLEQKSGPPTKDDCLQAEEYALLLHYFHRPSNQRRIVPFVVSPEATTESPCGQRELAFADSAAYWISPIVRVHWDQLATSLLPFASTGSATDPIDPDTWDAGEYFPVPSIIEAARSLQSGLSIREIAHSRAARHDIDNLTAYIKSRIAQARAENLFAICFVTGVPGSGKSLVGLNLAFSSRAEGETMNFMSGNGPLVDVFQSLFASYEHRVNGFRANEAHIRARTFIEDVHLFAKTYTQLTPDSIPSNHVVIFDEAQRAWNYEQSFRKFKRDYSEPEMFLRIMERHHDWAVIIALVGGGQEINDGEAGLSEWGRALASSNKPWKVFASPDVLHGGDSVAGGRLITDEQARPPQVEEDAALHLTVSVRSLGAENYSKWVNCVIDGDYKAAASLNIAQEFPVYLTRNLAALRQHLKNHTIGFSRCGLVGSSKATRLRAEGLEPDSSFHAEYDWGKWYLAPSSDVRSSTQLEVYATEFEIQGLELDWIGLCWGGDLFWSESQRCWIARKFRNASSSGWSLIRDSAAQNFRRNSYRVLLTRARQGLIINVPTGDPDDSTRIPAEFDATAAFLISCGVQSIPSS
jgi:hypothetical protein